MLGPHTFLACQDELQDESGEKKTTRNKTLIYTTAAPGQHTLVGLLAWLAW